MEAIAFNKDELDFRCAPQKGNESPFCENTMKPKLLERLSSNWSLNWNWRSWVTPTSDDDLHRVESVVLNAFGVKYSQQFVTAGSHTINTVIAGNGPPLVLFHGFGAGLGLWVYNLRHFAEHHTVYAIDLPGFGRSSRVPFNGTTYPEAEHYFLEALEQWRIAMGLNEKFDLVGHSFGGYLAASYALNHPTYVKRLILADPWGISQYPETGALSDLALWVRVLRKVAIQMNLLHVMRLSGPVVGRNLVGRFRRDLAQKFANVYGNTDTMVDYLYHINAQTPGGESAFSIMHNSLRWSKEPLLGRLHRLHPEIPATVIYGDKSWLSKETEMSLSQQANRPIQCVMMENCGHHIYADDHNYFNKLVLSLTGMALQG